MVIMSFPLISASNSSSLVANQELQRQQSLPHDSAEILKTVGENAVMQPVENLQKIRKASSVLTAVVRMRNSAAVMAGGVFRWGWDKGVGKALKWGFDKVGYEALAFTANQINKINDQYHLVIGADSLLHGSEKSTPMRGSDVRESIDHLMAALVSPQPHALVEVVDQIEEIREEFSRIPKPIQDMALFPPKLVLSTTITGPAKLINLAYKTFYKKDLSAVIPDMPPLPKVLCLNNRQEHLPFAERLDEAFLRQFPSTELVNLPGKRALTCVNGNPLVFSNLFVDAQTVLKDDLMRVFHNLTHRVLYRTQKQRISLIEAVEGMVLRMIWDNVVKRMPKTETCAREITLFLLQATCFDLLTAAITKQLPYPFHLMEKLPDGVTFLARGYASVVGQLAKIPLSPILSLNVRPVEYAVEKVTTVALTNGLQYGPMMHSLLCHEMDHWAKEGNKRIQQFGTADGLVHLALGQKYQSDSPSSDELDALITDNQEYLMGICAEFTLGVLGRMCEDLTSRDPHHPGAFGLLQLGLNSLLNSCFENQSEQTKDTDVKSGEAVASASAPVQEIPGMKEAKRALHQLLNEMKASFFEELKAELKAEFELQKKDVKRVVSETRENQKSVFRKQAQVLTAPAAPFLSLEKREAAVNVVESVLDAPAKLASWLHSTIAVKRSVNS